MLICRRPKGGEDIDHLGLLGTSGMSQLLHYLSESDGNRIDGILRTSPQLPSFLSGPGGS